MSRLLMSFSFVRHGAGLPGRDAYFQLNNYVETPCLLSPTINKTSCFLYQVNLQLPNQERQTHLATKSKTQP